MLPDALRYEYAWRQINPIYNTEGGEPGGNIRVAFMFNTKRVSFVDRKPSPEMDPDFTREVSSSRAVVPVKLGDEYVHAVDRGSDGLTSIPAEERKSRASSTR